MSDSLTAWLDSLGATTLASPGEPPSSPSVWLDIAEGRPAWMLWGKARPASSCPAHPLLCHMLDVAAVASRLLTSILPPALRQRFLSVDPDARQALGTLLFVIALHDLGKATPAFQVKAGWAKKELGRRGFDLASRLGARHHGDIGFYFLYHELERRGAPPEAACGLARAVTAHHGQFPTDATLLDDPGGSEAGRAPAWQRAREALVAELANVFQIDAIATPEDLDSAYVALLAGLTSVADWVGSMAEVFTYEPPQGSLETYWPRALARADRALELAGLRRPSTPHARSFVELFGKTPWPLHRASETIAAGLSTPSLIIIEAPMGEGKTEAAMLLAEHAATLAGQNGLYIGLPTKATANQMFRRVQGFLDRSRSQQRSTLVLAHGEASLVEQFREISMASIWDQGSDRTGVAAERWFLSKKRTLLADFGVGTIDQALLAVMRTSHNFVRLYALAGKTVVLDEVHAYDTYTGTLLERLLEWLAAAGTTVILLSATLPSERRAALVRAYQRGGQHKEIEPPTVPYPRITVAAATTSVHGFEPRSASVEIRLERAPAELTTLAAQVAERVRAGGCVGWICNTVDRAQRATSLLQELCPAVDARLLLHARLFPEERGRRETQLERWLGSEAKAGERPRACIVVGTQVLEQSLDIDFDLLVTDLAPIDLVLQRAGRLWRHQRHDRSVAHPQPAIVVAMPSGPSATAPLDEVAAVYSELLVRRTMELLEGREQIILPDDIEPLVEHVYAGVVPDEEDPLYAPFLAHYGVVSDERKTAVQRLMPRPDGDDDVFADLRVQLEDTEDWRLHQELRAETRLGPPSVQLVCLERRGEQVVLGGGNAEPVDLVRPPDRELEERLVRRSISTSRASIVQALQADRASAPQAWKDSALLRYRRLVVFEAGRARVGNTELELDPELGLVIGQ